MNCLDLIKSNWQARHFDQRWVEWQDEIGNKKLDSNQ